MLRCAGSKKCVSEYHRHKTGRCSTSDSFFMSLQLQVKMVIKTNDLIILHSKPIRFEVAPGNWSCFFYTKRSNARTTASPRHVDGFEMKTQGAAALQIFIAEERSKEAMLSVKLVSAPDTMAVLCGTRPRSLISYEKNQHVVTAPSTGAANAREGRWSIYVCTSMIARQQVRLKIARWTRNSSPQANRICVPQLKERRFVLLFTKFSFIFNAR